MDHAFNLDWDPERRLLRANMFGYWDLATMGSFESAVTAFMHTSAPIGFSEAKLLLLVDRRRQSVQSQAVAERIAVMVSSVGVISRKTAILVESTLLQMQTNRIRDTAERRFFPNEKEAIAWLMEE